MKRDLAQLTARKFDLVIVGGGIHGACVAWDAALRGLSVALLEKSDFGAGTSANSLKIIHGGLRYLQHGDLKRVLESIRERTIILEIAPHLVHPLPVAIPTYGHGMRGREIMALALIINDLASINRNRSPDPARHIPGGRTVSREECLQLVPVISQRGLTGAALYYDAQVYNSERLPLAFIRSAVNAGAQVANYAKVTQFCRESDRVTGVRATDINTGDQFDVRAKIVVNASGPWINQALAALNGHSSHAEVRFAKAINLVIPALFDKYAVGLYSEHRQHDTDVIIKKDGRFLFCVPWRGRSVIGTDYVPFEGDPDHCQATEAEVQKFLKEIKEAHPAANLESKDVYFVHSGLLPITGVHEQTGSVQLTKHYQIQDYRQLGVRGLISLSGVKYTTARHVAEKVVDLVFDQLNKPPVTSSTAFTPLDGGKIEQFKSFLEAETQKRPCALSTDTMRRLIYNYGSGYPEVLKYVDRRGFEDTDPSDEQAVLKAEVLHAINEEMAQRLSDVVFRRTELGTAGNPGQDSLQLCADVMGEQMGWSQSRLQQEMDTVKDAFWGLGKTTDNG